MVFDNNDNDGQFPQPDSLGHIFEILNDVKAEQLPVSDAVDSLAYWYHEAFAQGDISVEPGDANSPAAAGESDTEFGDLAGNDYMI